MSWLPHRFCIFGDNALITGLVITNLVIALAYFWIPWTLFQRWRKERIRLDAPAITLMFAAFIMFCGLTHVMDVVTLWWPAYDVDLWVRIATAALSIGTAIIAGPALARMQQLRDRLSDLERTLDGGGDGRR